MNVVLASMVTGVQRAESGAVARAEVQASAIVDDLGVFFFSRFSGVLRSDASCGPVGGGVC